MKNLPVALGVVHSLRQESWFAQEQTVSAVLALVSVSCCCDAIRKKEEDVEAPAAAAPPV